MLFLKKIIDWLHIIVLIFSASIVVVHAQVERPSPAQQLAAGSITVGSLQFVGDVSIKEKKLRQLLPFAEGDVIDSGDVRTAYKQLFATGYFKNIVFDLSEVSDYFVLTVQLEENIKLGSVQFVGNHRYSDFLLKKEADIDTSYYDVGKIPLAKAAIEEKYYKEGYMHAKVTSVIEDVGAARKNIIFFIEEGLQYVVKKIDFVGNNNLTAYKLRGVLSQKKKSLIAKAFLNELKVSESKEKLTFRYKVDGYVRFKIADTKFNFYFKDPKKKKVAFVDIIFAVEEGAQYKFGDYEIVGNKIFSKKTLTKNFRRLEGEIYNEQMQQDDLGSIYKYYQENGYIFARVTPIVEIDDAALLVSHRFEIYEGEKGHIEKIFVEGLRKTKKNVVKRELVIREGEIFSSAFLQRSLINLNRLNYFQEVVPDFRPGSVEGLLTLLLRIKEKQTAVISGGFTYSTTSGFALTASLRDSNFLGRGYSFGGKLSVGPLVKSLDINFVEPWFLNQSISLGVNFSISQIYSDYYVDANLLRKGGNVAKVKMPGGGEPDFVNRGGDSLKYTTDNISFSIFSAQRFLIFYQFSELFGVDIMHDYLKKKYLWPEKYSQYDIYMVNRNLFSTPPPIDETNISYFLKFAFSRDSLDNNLNPTTGNYFKISSTIYFGAKNAILWDINYNTYYSPVRIPIPLLGSAFTFTFFYQFNVASFANPIVGNFAYPNRSLLTYSLPVEMRGWEYLNIFNLRNARYGAEGLVNDTPYGFAKMQHTFEIRTSIPVDYLQFVLFLDMGNLSVDKIGVNPESLSFLFDVKNMMYDAGFGFRLNLPQLPIRFYWSWRFIYDHTSERLRLFEHSFDKKTSTYPPDFVLDFQANL